MAEPEKPQPPQAKTAKPETAKAKPQPPVEAEAKPPSPKKLAPEGLFAITRDQIFKAKDIQEEWVEVPEWNDGMKAAVLVRGLDGVQRDAFDRSNVLTDADGKNRRVNWINMRARLVQRTCIDPVDNLYMFEESDVMALGKKSGAALNRVFTAAARLSGISADEQKRLAENLEQANSEGSVSDSPSRSGAQSPSS